MMTALEKSERKVLFNSVYVATNKPAPQWLKDKPTNELRGIVREMVAGKTAKKPSSHRYSVYAESDLPYSPTEQMFDSEKEAVRQAELTRNRLAADAIVQVWTLDGKLNRSRLVWANGRPRMHGLVSCPKCGEKIQ